MKIIKEIFRAFKDRGAREIIFAGLISLVFGFGLLLGGIIASAKYKKECVDKLNNHTYSVVVIDSDIADSVGFKPRNKYDEDLREAKWER